MAELAPMPSASVSTTVAVSPLLRASERNANFRSRRNVIAFIEFYSFRFYLYVERGRAKSTSNQNILMRGQPLHLRYRPDFNDRRTVCPQETGSDVDRLIAIFGLD